jgi:hypothetical protein
MEATDRQEGSADLSGQLGDLGLQFGHQGARLHRLRDNRHTTIEYGHQKQD